MAQKKHEVTVTVDGIRYTVVELPNDAVNILRGGTSLGKGQWKNDQFVHMPVGIPDDVYEKLEKAYKKEVDSNWGED